MKPQTFHISARKWFDKVNGNTYHSVTIYQDGTIVAEAPYQYGYGDQYTETAASLLQALGTLSDRITYTNGGQEQLRQWSERTGFAYSIDCADVARKKDL